MGSEHLSEWFHRSLPLSAECDCKSREPLSLKTNHHFPLHLNDLKSSHTKHVLRPQPFPPAQHSELDFFHAPLTQKRCSQRTRTQLHCSLWLHTVRVMINPLLSEGNEYNLQFRIQTCVRQTCVWTPLYTFIAISSWASDYLTWISSSNICNIWINGFPR